MATHISYFFTLASLFLIACGEKVVDTGQEDTAVAPTSGGLALRFQIDEDYAALMDEPPSGTLYGSFWRAEDVDAIGPIDGAIALNTIELSIELDPSGAETEILWTEENLPVQEVYFLGFIDSDGNSDPEATHPDSKDPVTLPSDNDFDVIGGEITEVTVLFAMLYP